MSVNRLSCKEAIANRLLELAEKDRDIIVVSSDSRGSASLTKFAAALPRQFVEVGIAEQNLVAVAAGLAACGKKVFAVAPASFLSARAIEQIKVDVGYNHTNVKLIGVSGGISYGPWASPPQPQRYRRHYRSAGAEGLSPRRPASGGEIGGQARTGQGTGLRSGGPRHYRGLVR